MLRKWLSRAALICIVLTPVALFSVTQYVTWFGPAIDFNKDGDNLRKVLGVLGVILDLALFVTIVIVSLTSGRTIWRWLVRNAEWNSSRRNLGA